MILGDSVLGQTFLYSAGFGVDRIEATAVVLDPPREIGTVVQLVEIHCRGCRNPLEVGDIITVNLPQIE
ncbi:MAG: hypothetical protein Q7S03_03100 [bacterium]|nr:hypothetical protein [bacterium]